MKNLLTAIVPIAGVVVGAFLTYFFTSRTNRDESIARFKEEKYARLLVKLQGFMGITSSAQLKREFFEEQYQSWLYASDDAVAAINKLVRLIIDNRGIAVDEMTGRKVVGEVVLAMRRDLLGRTGLTYEEFRYTDVIEN